MADVEQMDFATKKLGEARTRPKLPAVPQTSLRRRAA
jgi:hypothetical protein